MHARGDGGYHPCIFKRHFFLRGLSRLASFKLRAPANGLVISASFGDKFLKTSFISHEFTYQKPKCLYMGDWLSPSRTQLVAEIEATFRWLPYVFGVELSNGTEMKDVRQTESGKSNMAAFKVEVPSSQLVDKIGTESQQLYLNVLEVQLSN